MKGCIPFSQKQTKDILSTLSARDKTLVTLGCSTGFRISELLSLKWDMLIKDGVVVDVLYVPRRSRKGKREGHQVPLNAACKRQVLQWHKVCGGTEHVFPSRQGGPLSRRQATHIIKKAARSVGITGPVATHSMRKTFCDRVYTASGQDLHTTQLLLGHKNISSTVHYLVEKQKKAARVVSSIKI